MLNYYKFLFLSFFEKFPCKWKSFLNCFCIFQTIEIIVLNFILMIFPLILKLLSIISVTILLLQEWDMLSFIRSLKSMVRSSNSVAIITFLPSLLSPSFCKRWQHMADTLLSVKAIPGLLSVYTLWLWYALLISNVYVYWLIDLIGCFCQMKTRNWHNSSLVTRIWLAFWTCTK